MSPEKSVIVDTHEVNSSVHQEFSNKRKLYIAELCSRMDYNHEKKLFLETTERRPDLREAIVWDITHNGNDIYIMLNKLYQMQLAAADEEKKKIEERIESALHILIAAGASIDDDFKISVPISKFKREFNPQNPSHRIESPFRTEQLRLEEVAENISFEKGIVVDAMGNEIEQEYLIVEFSLSSWMHIHREHGWNQENKNERDRIHSFLKTRYQWGTNILKDKKFQVTRQLAEQSSDAIKTLLKSAGYTEDVLYSDKGIEFANVRAHQREFARELSKILGINKMLDRRNLYINADHGWCGDSSVMAAFTHQSLYDVNKALVEQKRQLKNSDDYEAIAITSDNMGIVRARKDKRESGVQLSLFQKVQEDVKKYLGAATEAIFEGDNPNLSEDIFMGFAKQDSKGDALFTQHEYGFDMLWKANMVFGLLGEVDGYKTKIIWAGWSFGGGATKEFAAQMLEVVENNWILEIYTRNSAEIKYWKNYLVSYNSSADIRSRIQGRIKTMESQQSQLIKGQITLPNKNVDQDIGLPNIFFLPLAPADKETCGFLKATQSQVDATYRLLSNTSGLIVSTGVVMHKVNAARLLPVYALLDEIAFNYTGVLLPGDDPIMVHVREIHQRNFVRPINRTAVRYQTKGLLEYSGPQEKYLRLLRTGHARMITVLGTHDNLVLFPDGVREAREQNIGNIHIAADANHCVHARLRGKMPAPMLATLTHQEFDEVEAAWIDIADLELDIPTGSSIEQLSRPQLKYKAHNIRAHHDLVEARNRAIISVQFDPLKKRLVEQTTRNLQTMIFIPRKI